MTKQRIIFLLLASVMLLSGCTTDAETKTRNEDHVNSISFQDRNTIILDTERLVIATDTHNVQFIETTTDEFVIYERDIDSILSFLNDQVYYTVEIPTEQIKDISREHAEVFGETLPLESTDEDE